MKAREDKELINQQELKDLVNYDPATGIFTWKVKYHRSIKVGKIAGSLRGKSDKSCGRNYVRLNIKRKSYFAHRLAWLYMKGVYPSDQIDHIDGNGLNNRIDNLRDVSHKENGMNQRLPRRNTSGVCGVWWNKQKNMWQADIVAETRKVFIGLFRDINEASKARKDAEDYYGFHPNHGRTS